MDTWVQADIFFFITSAAVLVVTIATLIALCFFIQILRDVRYTSKKVREETDKIISDVDGLREFVKKEGKRAINIKELVSGVLHIFQGNPPRRRSADEAERRVRKGG